ncbi:MAG: hypothetical protein KGY41_01205 [Desulfovermiculus sp.]|nr:hypothetical protein [Desulfovermiculus sp.]
MIISPRIYRTIQNHFVSILGLIAICILLFAFIFPTKHRIEDIQGKIISVQEEVNGHQSAISLLENKLASLRQTRAKRKDQFQELESELETLQEKLGEKVIFHLPEISPFPESADMLPKRFKDMAGKLGLQEMIVDMYEPAHKMNGPSIAVTITASGSLPDFRAFLIQLLETSYVAAINQLQLSSCQSGLCLDLDLMIRL